jgi:glycosyltransferase involved in cell wall biosynthesis
MSQHLCLLGDANHVHVRRWAYEMLQRGYRVSIVTARPQVMEGVTQRVLAPVARSWQWLFRARQARALIRELNPDMVHAHYVTSYGYLGALAGRRPLVMTAWGTDVLVTPRANPWMKALTRFILRRADLLTGDSADLVQEMHRLAPEVRLHEIHWGADLSRFSPVAWTAKRGFPLVSLRSWEPNYQIDLIIQAFAQLRERLPALDTHLHLLGGGSMGPQLRQLVQTLGLQAHVTFHGRLGEPAMVSVMQGCKVSVSVPLSDATSVSVLESMACGMAVLGSDLPANRQWLSPDACVPAGDVGALAERLVQWAQDDARTRARGEANLARMVQEGARSVQMDRMHALYQALLSARRGQPGGARSGGGRK